jgi:FKBP-type peptidyl-prolyl cis-trans isomerase
VLTRSIAATLRILSACARVHADTAAVPPEEIAARQASVLAAAPPLAADPKPLPSAAAPDEAEVTASGIAYVVLEPGTGTEHPGPGAMIRAHYVAWTASDLQKFDDSYERGQPIEFRADDVIEGWGEAIGMMTVGEVTRFWIPESLAYEGKVGMPAGMLIFEIELLGFEPAR